MASTNAPSDRADVPANALDGSWSTRFSTDKFQTAGLYFEVNLGSPQAFNELEMDVPNSRHDYARDYDVEVSANGTSWTTVASCRGWRRAGNGQLPHPNGELRRRRPDGKQCQVVVVDRRVLPEAQHLNPLT